MEKVVLLQAIIHGDWNLQCTEASGVFAHMADGNVQPCSANSIETDTADCSVRIPAGFSGSNA